MIQGLRRIYRYAVPYWKLILLTFLSMIVYSIGVNGRAYIIKPFLEQVILPAEDIRSTFTSGAALDWVDQLERSPEELKLEQESVRNAVRGRFLPLLLVALGIVALIPAANFVRGYLSVYVVNRMLIDLQCDLCDKFLQMPLAFHTRQQKGDVFARLNSDVTNASLSFKLILGDLIQESLTLLVGVAVMFYLSWQLTLLLAVILPPLVLIIVKFGKKIRKKSVKRQEQIGTLMGAMIQMFSGIKVVKAFRKEAHEGRRFRDLNLEVFRRNMKVAKTEVTSRSVTELFNNATYILFLGVGVLAIINSALGLTFPVLVAFLVLAPTLYRPVKNMSRAYNQISDAMAGIERISEIMDIETQDQQDRGTRELTEVRNGIHFHQVDFAYDGPNQILHNINLEIKKGETVALVGKTGTGKTTLSDLILRFYDPTAGTIAIDGTDIREFTRESLLEHVAIVTQEPFLFDTTLEENIRYGNMEATREEIEAAAKAAHIHEMILSLPQRYDTTVGERGARLSGGERQRVTIARAILKNPSILILDEATASLDAESEKLVQDALENLMQERTTLVIAHRFSTILKSDKIAVMEEGQITMTGTHEDLLKKGGLYKELCALQFLPNEEKEQY